MLYEVVIDSDETPNKCTIAPLGHRPDFRIYPAVIGRTHLPRLKSTLLLHHEGECLTTLRRHVGTVQGIATIDCIWRRLDTLIGQIEKPLPLLAKIPDGFQTAYPRRSENNSDPEGGLATIEAIFVAAALLGHWDPTLFSQYFFGRKFIEMNRERFLSLDVREADDPEAQPVMLPRVRNSQQRRRDRGKY